MLSQNTKKLLGEILVTVGMGQSQLSSIKEVLCNQSKFILELAHQRLACSVSRTITPSSLKSLLAENNIQCSEDEILIVFVLYSKFERDGLSLSE